MYALLVAGSPEATPLLAAGALNGGSTGAFAGVVGGIAMFVYAVVRHRRGKDDR